MDACVVQDDTLDMVAHGLAYLMQCFRQDPGDYSSPQGDVYVYQVGNLDTETGRWFRPEDVKVCTRPPKCRDQMCVCVCVICFALIRLHPDVWGLLRVSLLVSARYVLYCVRRCWYDASHEISRTPPANRMREGSV